MLTYRDKGTSDTQLEIISELPIGSVGKNVLSIAAGRAVTWSWTLRLDAAPPGFQRHGVADKCTKAGVERNWRMWLDAAGLKE
jgi:hypothetical protein